MGVTGGSYLIGPRGEGGSVCVRKKGRVGNVVIRRANGYPVLKSKSFSIFAKLYGLRFPEFPG